MVVFLTLNICRQLRISVICSSQYIMSLVGIFWVIWRKMMQTREVPDFWGLHKNMNLRVISTVCYFFKNICRSGICMSYFCKLYNIFLTFLENKAIQATQQYFFSFSFLSVNCSSVDCKLCTLFRKFSDMRLVFIV